MPFTDIVKIGSGKGVVLCRAVSAETGEELFHYIKATRQYIEQMHRDYRDGKAADFSQYGEIIHSGWGEPSEEDEKIVKQKIGK